MPILPDETTARFALALNRSSFFSYIPGPTLAGAESLNLAVTEVQYNTEADTIFYTSDPDGLFDDSAISV